jgi:hypothetical protein
MLEILWTVLKWVLGAAFTYLLSLIAAALVGLGGGLGLIVGLADDIVLILLSSSLTIVEVFALQVLIDEIEKIVHETLIWNDEEDAQRDARHAALVRWHGQKTYLFGDISLQDVALTAGSAYVLAGSELAESVFQVAGEAAIIL